MHESENTIDHKVQPRSRWSNSRRAIAVSIVFHLVLIGVLLVWYLPPPNRSGDGGGMAATTSGEVGGQGDLVPHAPPMPSAQADVPPEQIQASLASQIESIERLADEQKLSELEKNLARLQSIATEESVHDVTTTIANALGLEPGVVPAQQPPDGVLDPETAQIHEITRVRGESGQWEYASLLVDAHGRTQTVPLSESEGETAYRTFEQLKRYPMADGIYRQLVMPMIQKMIQASAITEQAAREAKQMQLESTDSPVETDQP